VAAQSSGSYNFVNRNYAVELPNNYQPGTSYPVLFTAGGCNNESVPSFDLGESGVIKVSLIFVNTCFADGGTKCALSAMNDPLCVNTPEIPYFSAVLDEIESKLCVDLGRVFIGGASSGAWEALTLGCVFADRIRGVSTQGGGLRNHLPACTGPLPALMVVSAADAANPIGPLVQDMPYPPAGLTAPQVDTLIEDLDSNGSAPERDALLQRNGCAGTITAPYDPKYPECVKYTGCPNAYPVVWCALPDAAHGANDYGGINYVPGDVSGDPLMWGFLEKLSSP
jgi:poly(3-hydroxybutyrate) depolymerase